MGTEPRKIQSMRTPLVRYVADLILLEEMTWNVDLVDSIFSDEEAKIIKGIPLSKFSMVDRLV